MADKGHEELQHIEDQEERIKQRPDDESFMEAVSDEMNREMAEKTPAEAIKDDLKGIGQDLKESLTGDGDEGRSDR